MELLCLYFGAAHAAPMALQFYTDLGLYQQC